MLDINVILKGHFRTFADTHTSWDRALAPYSHKMYLHTWNTKDCDTKSWHKFRLGTQALTDAEHSLLRHYDPEYVVEEQTFTEKERNAIAISRPFKTYLYFWQGIHSCLSRITEPSKYILIGRYDMILLNDVLNISCEPDEIVIGYAPRSPPTPTLKYGMTDIVFLIRYEERHKLEKIPANILEMPTKTYDCRDISEDPMTEFYQQLWSKVTPRWLIRRDIDIKR